MNKTYVKIMDRKHDASINFADLCKLLKELGFLCRINTGSHKRFYKDGIVEIINIQPATDGKSAKNYQVKQIRGILIKYGLEVK